MEQTMHEDGMAMSMSDLTRACRCSIGTIGSTGLSYHVACSVKANRRSWLLLQV